MSGAKRIGVVVVGLALAASVVAWRPSGSGDSAERRRAADPKVGVDLHERWRVEFPGEVVGLPASDAAGVVVTVDGANVASISPNGEIEWTTPVPGALAEAPRIDDDGVFVATDRAVVALRRDTGAVVWTASTSSGGENRANRPAVAGDLVIASAADGLLMAADRATGAIRWSHQLRTPVTSHPAVGAGVDDDPVVVVVGSGEWRAFDAATGAELWAGSVGVFGTSSPVVYASGSGTLAAVATDEQLVAVDATTGAVRWTAPAEQSELFQTPVLARNGTELLVPDHWGRVAAYDPYDGRQFWRTGGSESIAEFGEPVLLGDRIVATPLDDDGPRIASPRAAQRLRVPSQGHGVAGGPSAGLVVTTWGGTTNYVLLYEVRYP